MKTRKIVTPKDEDDEDYGKPVCPECGLSECRGSVGYKCQYLDNGEDF